MIFWIPITQLILALSRNADQGHSGRIQRPALNGRSVPFNYIGFRLENCPRALLVLSHTQSHFHVPLAMKPKTGAQLKILKSCYHTSSVSEFDSAQ